MSTDFDRHQMFTDRYQNNEIPWDTGITPPEIVQIVAELPPGRALDLGCGTGTNVRYLLDHGWEADGVDFVQQAIDTARAKLAAYPAERWGAFCHDVTRLESCTGLRPPYDLVIDIGCGHGVDSAQQSKYAQDIANLLRSGGVFMLYAHFTTGDDHFNWEQGDVERLFAPFFDIISQVISSDTTNGHPSGWYRLQRKS